MGSPMKQVILKEGIYMSEVNMPGNSFDRGMDYGLIGT